MKKILLAFIALFVAVLSISSANANQTVRVQILGTPGKNLVTAHVSLPISGNMSTFSGSSYVEGKPLFVTEDNEVVLMFDLLCSGSYRVTVSNGAGYSKTVTMSSSTTFNETTPLNPSGFTIISLQIVS